MCERVLRVPILISLFDLQALKSEESYLGPVGTRALVRADSLCTPSGETKRAKERGRERSYSSERKLDIAVRYAIDWRFSESSSTSEEHIRKG